MLLLADSVATREWFVGDFVPELLEFVLVTWSSFQKDPAIRLEQRITNRFSDALEQAYEEQGKDWFLVPDMKRTDPSTGKEIARHDIRFFHREISGQRLYFIFECKRLNVLNKRKKFVPNSSGYRAGMIKFVNGTYGTGLPCGAMIGYVIDSNLATAFVTVKNLIKKNRHLLQVSPGGDYCPSPLMPKHIHNGQTKHTRSDGDFTLYHLLLP